LCNSELRSFEERLGDFDRRRVRLLAISVDPPEVNRRHRQELGLSFTFLSDPKAEVIRRYDLLHPGGGPGSTDIARPAEFLVDPSGTIRWVNLTESITVRARPEQVLSAIDRLLPGASGSPP
jgi:glutaredoxin-dependent peroxiredoxin